MPDTPRSVQLSYMTRTEPLTEETLAYLVRTEAEHAAHLDALTAAVLEAINDHADIRLPDGRLAIARDHAIEVIRGVLEPHDA